MLLPSLLLTLKLPGTLRLLQICRWLERALQSPTAPRTPCCIPPPSGASFASPSSKSPCPHFLADPVVPWLSAPLALGLPIFCTVSPLHQQLGRSLREVLLDPNSMSQPASETWGGGVYCTHLDLPAVTYQGLPWRRSTVHFIGAVLLSDKTLPPRLAGFLSLWLRSQVSAATPHPEADHHSLPCGPSMLWLTARRHTSPKPAR